MNKYFSHSISYTSLTGAARRKSLMKYYESLEDIKKATVEELRAVPGMNEKSAQAVVAFFSQDNT